MAHGHIVDLHDVIHLADLYFDRPIVRLALWICAGNRDKWAFSGHSETFAKLCYRMRPFHDCPCECRHEDCRSLSADNLEEKCPVGKRATTTIVSAGYYKHGATYVPSALTLSYPPGITGPFVAPDGVLIETSITNSSTQDGAVSYDPQPVSNGTVFAGMGVATGPDPGGVGGTPLTNPSSYLKPVVLRKAPTGSGTRPEYKGPKSSDMSCPGRDGCMRGVR
jgi:hypothetical protein